MEGQEKPWPDFDVTRKCVNYDKFYEWQVEPQLPRKRLADVKRKIREGKRQRPIEPELKKMQEGAKGERERYGEHAGHHVLGQENGHQNKK